MDRLKQKDANDISEEQVVQYLKNYPGFFLRRDDLLCELELSHPSGGAVSLLERQVSLLRERNMDMRNRLSHLLDNAKKNDLLLQNTQKLVLALLEASSLDSLVQQCCKSLKQDFGLDYCSLIVFANPAQQRSFRTRVVARETAEEHIAGLISKSGIRCGVLRPEESAFLFGKEARQIGSAAVATLGENQMQGVLAIGSSDPNYFQAGMGTVFIDYICAVLNRLLPPQLHATGSARLSP